MQRESSVEVHINDFEDAGDAAEDAGDAAEDVQDVPSLLDLIYSGSTTDQGGYVMTCFRFLNCTRWPPGGARDTVPGHCRRSDSQLVSLMEGEGVARK